MAPLFLGNAWKLYMSRIPEALEAKKVGNWSEKDGWSIQAFENPKVLVSLLKEVKDFHLWDSCLVLPGLNKTSISMIHHCFYFNLDGEGKVTAEGKVENYFVAGIEGVARYSPFRSFRASDLCNPNITTSLAKRKTNSFGAPSPQDMFDCASEKDFLELRNKDSSGVEDFEGWPSHFWVNPNLFFAAIGDQAATETRPERAAVRVIQFLKLADAGSSKEIGGKESQPGELFHQGYPFLKFLWAVGKGLFPPISDYNCPWHEVRFSQKVDEIYEKLNKVMIHLRKEISGPSEDDREAARDVPAGAMDIDRAEGSEQAPVEKDQDKPGQGAPSGTPNKDPFSSDKSPSSAWYDLDIGVEPGKSRRVAWADEAKESDWRDGEADADAEDFPERDYGSGRKRSRAQGRSRRKSRSRSSGRRGGKRARRYGRGRSRSHRGSGRGNSRTRSNSWSDDYSVSSSSSSSSSKSSSSGSTRSGHSSSSSESGGSSRSDTKVGHDRGDREVTRSSRRDRGDAAIDMIVRAADGLAKSQSKFLKAQKEAKSNLGNLADDQRELFRLLNTRRFSRGAETPGLSKIARRLDKGSKPRQMIANFRSDLFRKGGHVSIAGFSSFITGGFYNYSSYDKPGGFTVLMFKPRGATSAEESLVERRRRLKELFGAKELSEAEADSYTKLDYHIADSVRNLIEQLDVARMAMDMITTKDGIGSEAYRLVIDRLEDEIEAEYSQFSNDKYFCARVLYLTNVIQHRFFRALIEVSRKKRPYEEAI